MWKRLRYPRVFLLCFAQTGRLRGVAGARNRRLRQIKAHFAMFLCMRDIGQEW